MRVWRVPVVAGTMFFAPPPARRLVLRSYLKLTAHDLGLGSSVTRLTGPVGRSFPPPFQEPCLYSTEYAHRRAVSSTSKYRRLVISPIDGTAKASCRDGMS